NDRRPLHAAGEDARKPRSGGDSSAREPPLYVPSRVRPSTARQRSAVKREAILRLRRFRQAAPGLILAWLGAYVLGGASLTFAAGPPEKIVIPAEKFEEENKEPGGSEATGLGEDDRRF